MKLAATAAARFCEAPDPAIGGILLYGPDPVLVAERRRAIVCAVLGDGDDAALRLERIPVADARRSAGIVADALAARGFFPGRRVVLIEDGTDGLAAGLKDVVAAHEPDDALLVVTADALPARSSLRKLFETGRSIAAAALYPEPPGPDEIAARLRSAGCTAQLAPDAAEALVSLGSESDTGALAQIIEKIALFCTSEDQSVTLDMVEALAPATERASYSASKAAVTGLTRTLALELAPHGITVNGVAPGPIETEMFSENQPTGSPAREALLSRVPLRRMGAPEEVAAAVAHLASDEAGFTTGQMLHVCGGFSVGVMP